jgi:hypothetical protein
MMQLNSHFRQVEFWVEHKLKDQSRMEVIDAFHKAFQRVWSKAELTLGRVTMLAITDRIVHAGHEKYSWLSPINKNNDGIDLTELAQNTAHISDAELRLGLSSLLGEFLHVLGSLTAEIISFKLHAALMEDPGGESLNAENTSEKKDSNSPVAKVGKYDD